MHVCVILNPKAGAGSAARRLPEIRRALDNAGIRHDVMETEGPGDAARLARKAREHGVELIAVVGGDGTLNEVTQAYLEGEGRPLEGPELALIPSGTGGDFRKTFGLGSTVEEAVERLAKATPRAIDLGIARLTGEDGRPATMAFVNILSFGIGGLVDRLVNTGPKWLGGKAAFFFATLRANLSYRNAPVLLRVDGKTHIEGPIFNVAIANGRYFGGGMQVAPEADPQDGLFDVVTLYDLGRLEALGLASKIYKGTHIGTPGVFTTRGRLVEAEPLRPEEPVLIDMDGETPGRLPLRIEVAPGALRFRI